MMTCKDCKNRRHCNSVLKSYVYGEDRDSWANWCDDFVTRHKSKKIHKDGFIVTQSGYNWHIMIADEKNKKVLLHASCTKRKSKRALKKMIDFYTDTLPKLKEMVANDDGLDEFS